MVLFVGNLRKILDMYIRWCICSSYWMPEKLVKKLWFYGGFNIWSQGGVPKIVSSRGEMDTIRGISILQFASFGIH